MALGTLLGCFLEPLGAHLGSRRAPTEPKRGPREHQESPGEAHERPERHVVAQGSAKRVPKESQNEPKREAQGTKRLMKQQEAAACVQACSRVQCMQQG